MTEMPGGQASAFCEPVIMISAPRACMSNGSAKNELMQSTSKNRLLRLQKSPIIFMSYSTPVEVSCMLTTNAVKPLPSNGSRWLLASGVPASRAISSNGTWCSWSSSTKRWPKLPPLTTSTLSLAESVFMMDASIDAEPEPVMNTTREPSGAFANFLIRASFSNMTSENSDVLK